MFLYFPNFKIDDFVIREINPEKDAENFLDYISNPNVFRFIGDDSVPKNKQESIKELEYWRSLFYFRRSYYWAIADSDNNMIGTIGFNSINFQHKRGELSYDLSEKFWGRGIMTKSINRILKFAYDEMDLVRIQATVGMHNEKSTKLLENLNFKKEGELAKYECLQGNFYDFYMYAKIKE